MVRSSSVEVLTPMIVWTKINCGLNLDLSAAVVVDLVSIFDAVSLLSILSLRLWSHLTYLRALVALVVGLLR